MSVSGARQSGKTTLLRSIFSEYTYVNLELPDERERVKEDIRGFLRTTADRGAVIDEAQNVPELFSYLQAHVDETRAMGRYILSGSRNFLLTERITQSLSGRVGIVNLHPFALEELRGTDHWPENYLECLVRGFYPAIYDRHILSADYYPSYVQTYLERDVRSLRNVGNIDLFRRFLHLCAGRVGQIVNHSSLASDLGLDHKTVAAWTSVLEASFIVFFLRPHERNYNKRVIRQPKLYFYDTGLVCSLLGIRDAAELYPSHLRGNIFENFVVAEYHKLCANEGRPADAWYFRDRSGFEVDMIIDRAARLRPVEIKSSETVNDAFFKPLHAYQAMSRARPADSFLIYGGDATIRRKYATVVSWRDVTTIGSVSRRIRQKR